MLNKEFLDMKINRLLSKSKLKFVCMYLILFGIHHCDLIVTEIQYRIFFFVMISQLHKDNNTAVEDSRGWGDNIFYLQFPIL